MIKTLLDQVDSLTEYQKAYTLADLIRIDGEDAQAVELEEYGQAEQDLHDLETLKAINRKRGI